MYQSDLQQQTLDWSLKALHFLALRYWFVAMMCCVFGGWQDGRDLEMWGVVDVCILKAPSSKEQRLSGALVTDSAQDHGTIRVIPGENKWPGLDSCAVAGEECFFLSFFSLRRSHVLGAICYCFDPTLKSSDSLTALHKHTHTLPFLALTFCSALNTSTLGLPLLTLSATEKEEGGTRS